MSLKRIEAEISGRVQGVGFRYYVIDKAEILGITGWVANLPDGGVKTVAVGEEELIHDFLLYLKKGPSSARWKMWFTGLPIQMQTNSPPSTSDIPIEDKEKFEISLNLL